MGLSIDELELQSTDYLPAREVMSGFGGGHGGGHLFLQQGLVNVGVNVQDVNILSDINILTGKDSDVIDVA
ncbi:MAG: hypothetical protein ACRD2C_10315 [Acidimicrobiales bacterium]